MSDDGAASAGLAGMRRLSGGLLAALTGAALGCLVCAGWEARGAGDLGLWAICAGLSAPLAAVAGVAMAVFRALFLAGEAWSPLRLWRWLAGLRGAERAAWLVTPPLLAVAAPLALLAVAGVATRVLGADATPRAAMGLMALTFAPLALALVAGVRTAAAELGPRLDTERRSASPGVVLLASLGLGLAALALLISLGETGGGGGPWRILGVLRRDELDLRAPGLLLLVAAAALFVPRPSRALGGLLLLALALLPAVLTWQAARGLDAQAALAIEREAALSRVGLGLLRRSSDRDHDGVSAAF
ncbi:MAG TPA: hypothetical protein VIW29_02140, partial [Polyangiaceae bacterium]